MDDVRGRIVDLAMQIPGYLGYQAKDRRRDVDKLVRRQLAAKYDEQRTRLTRLSRKAPLDTIVELENLDQKLLRLIARFNTAPGGYAGWFDAAQIVESDLDELTAFDKSLTDGVELLKNALDRVAETLKSKEGFGDAVAVTAELLDSLNAQFDQREQFLALGKRPSLTVGQSGAPSSPLRALEQQKAPPADVTRLAALRPQDAVSYGNLDYLVSGRITFTANGSPFYAFVLRDGDRERWLRVGPANQVALYQLVEYSPSLPFPQSIEYDNDTYTLGPSGTANVQVEGAGGVKRGSVQYALYTGSGGSRLWVEDYGVESRAMWGQLVDPTDIKVFRR